MKKLELETLQTAVLANGDSNSDLFTNRQCDTLNELADAGLIVIERSERLKSNLNLIQYSAGSSSTIRDRLAIQKEKQEGETASAE